MIAETPSSARPLDVQPVVVWPRLADWLPVLAMVAIYTVAFSYLSIRQRAAMYQFDEDLAIFDQIVWNTAQGRPFASTLIQHAGNMFGDHFSPAIALFVPFDWLRPNATNLLIGQSLALALAAVPLYALARTRIGVLGGWAIAASYLAFPPLHGVNLFQFHEIALVALPLTLALLAIERGWRWRFIAAALLALSVKEEVAIVVAALGSLWWLRRRDWRMTIATVGLGIVVGIVTMGIILPRLNAADSGYYYVRRYAYLGDTPFEMMRSAITSPSLIVSRLVAPDRLRFVSQLVLPLLALPLVGWEMVVAAVPILGYLLLSESADQYRIDRHYLAPLLPFLFVGATLGIARLARGQRRPAAALAVAMLVAVALDSMLLGQTPWSRGYDPAPNEATYRTVQVRRLVDRVPPDVPVAASRNLLSWFSRRERVYRFPELGDAEHVLIDFRELRYPAAYDLDGGALGRLLASDRYRFVDSAGGAVYFVRGDPTGATVGADAPTRFGDDLLLTAIRVRYTPSRTTAELTLDWQADRPTRVPLTVFVHALDSAGERIGQHDAWPVDGLVPTTLFPAHHVIPDTHTLALARDPGPRVRFVVGVYEAASGRRLPIVSRGLPGGPDTVEIDATIELSAP